MQLYCLGCAYVHHTAQVGLYCLKRGRRIEPLYCAQQPAAFMLASNTQDLTRSQ